MKPFAIRLIIGGIALGIMSSILIATGKWEMAVIRPVSAVLGVEMAQELDAHTRKNLAESDAIARKMQNGEYNAKALVEGLRDVKLPKAGERMPKYERAQFGNGWQSDLDGCSTRERVLMRDLTNVKMRSDRKCKVESGVLSPDPYTGKKIAFNSLKDPQAVQIDHVVPLSLAWQMGAWKWDSNERVRFSNDLGNLLASDGPENGSKGDKGPARWMVPKNPAFVCDFSAQYLQVTQKYDLTMDAADQAKLEEVLAQC
ncbi:HNH endonuclease family protein [Leucobacter sp. HY1910]